MGAAATACTTSGPYTLSGCVCDACVCTHPDRTGYDTTGATLTGTNGCPAPSFPPSQPLAARLTERVRMQPRFNIEASCAANYAGTALVTPCVEVRTPNPSPQTLLGLRFVCICV